MFDLLLPSFYFFLPAYFTNMTPPTVKKAKLLESLNKPIDDNKKFIDGKPLLGSHKTWRGVLLGICAGITVAFIQAWLFRFPAFRIISIINYQETSPLLLGLILSVGAVLGDLSFAFIKRRCNLRPGAVFIPFDQINYVIGSSLLMIIFPIINVPGLVWINLFILTFFLHIIVNRLGYALNLHQAKW